MCSEQTLHERPGTAVGDSGSTGRPAQTRGGFQNMTVGTHTPRARSCPLQKKAAWKGLLWFGPAEREPPWKGHTNNPGTPRGAGGRPERAGLLRRSAPARAPDLRTRRNGLGRRVSVPLGWPARPRPARRNPAPLEPSLAGPRPAPPSPARSGAGRAARGNPTPPARGPAAARAGGEAGRPGARSST